ncbi:MAG: exosome complex exonuclease Rrp41 [Thermoplasmatota archaeon]
MGGNKPEGMVLMKDGRRMDGRRPQDLRPLRIEAGVLKRADGSCYLEWGGNKVLVAVYGPREAHPRHQQDPTQAIVRCRYNMAAFSVSDRKRPGPDRRSQEISKITSEAFEHVILTTLFPRTAIDVFIEVIEAEAGTRCAGITAASVALADAGIPMKGLVTAVAAGRVEGVVCLDLSREEDNFGETDFPIAIVPKTDEIVLLQEDGIFTAEQLDQALDLGIQAAHEIYEIQKRALRDRYRTAVEAAVEVEDSTPTPPSQDGAKEEGSAAADPELDAEESEFTMERDAPPAQHGTEGDV